MLGELDVELRILQKGLQDMNAVEPKQRALNKRSIKGFAL